MLLCVFVLKVSHSEEEKTVVDSHFSLIKVSSQVSGTVFPVASFQTCSIPDTL